MTKLDESVAFVDIDLSRNGGLAWFGAEFEFEHLLVEEGNDGCLVGLVSDVADVQATRLAVCVLRGGIDGWATLVLGAIVVLVA